jgi:UDP-glucose 4-epimerase
MSDGDDRTSGGLTRSAEFDDGRERFGADRRASSAVLIMGIGTAVGRRLTRALHREGRVIGLDRGPFPDRPRDVEHFELDPRSSRVRDLFRRGEVGAVVYLGVLQDPTGPRPDDYAWNVTAFQRLFEHVRDFAVPKFMLLSSAAVYGPSPDNPQFLSEDAPLFGGGSGGPVRDLGSLDLLAQSFFWKLPQVETVILRPVHIVGPLDNAPSNYLRLRHPPTLLGFDPLVQVVHLNDVVWALRRMLAPGFRGIFNLAGPPPCALSDALRLLHRQPLRLPHTLVRFGLERFFRWRHSEHPAPELDFLRFVCMVDDGRAREILDYRPRHGLSAILSAADDEHWVW